MRIEAEERFDKFEIAVDGNVYQVDVKKECAVDEQNVAEEFYQHASMYAWYASVLALYEAKADRLKYQVEVMESMLDRRIREDAVKVGSKIAEKQVEGAIHLDQKWQVLMDEYLDARSIVKRLAALVRALEMKRDMLIQVGARMRAELGLGKGGG